MAVFPNPSESPWTNPDNNKVYEYIDPPGAWFVQDDGSGGGGGDPDIEADDFVKREGDVMEGDLVLLPSDDVDLNADGEMSLTVPDPSLLEVTYRNASDDYRFGTVRLSPCEHIVTKLAQIQIQGTGGSGYCEDGETLEVTTNAEVRPTELLNSTQWQVETAVGSLEFEDLSGETGLTYTALPAQVGLRLRVAQTFLQGDTCEKVVHSNPIVVTEGVRPSEKSIIFNLVGTTFRANFDNTAAVTFYTYQESTGAWSITKEYAIGNGNSLSLNKSGMYALESESITKISFEGTGSSGLSFDERSYFSAVTTGYRMFYGCSGFSQDLEWLDTSAMTNMAEMFSGCNKFSGSLVDDWDTSKVTNVNNMFYASNRDRPPTGWNLSNVTDASWFFSYLKNCNIDFAEFSFDKVENFYGICKDVSNSTVIVRNQNYSNLQDISQMFLQTRDSNITLEDSDFSSATNASLIFSRCNSTLNVSNLDTSGATNWYGAFKNTSELGFSGSLDLNTSGATNISQFFQGSRIPADFDFSVFSFPSAVDASDFFYHTVWPAAIANQSNPVNLTNWAPMNTVVNGSRMFHQQYGTSPQCLPKFVLEGWAMDSLEDANAMFRGHFDVTFADWSPNITNLWDGFANAIFYKPQNFASWNVENCDNFARTFFATNISVSNSRYPMLGLSNWDVSNATNMQGMFYWMDVNKYDLDLKNWDVSKVENFASFSENHQNENPTWWNALESWNPPSAINMFRMLSGRSSLSNQNTPDLSGWCVSNVTNHFYFWQSSYKQHEPKWGTCPDTALKKPVIAIQGDADKAYADFTDILEITELPTSRPPSTESDMTYQWQRSTNYENTAFEDIEGQTSNVYLVRGADSGRVVRVKVSISVGSGIETFSNAIAATTEPDPEVKLFGLTLNSGTLKVTTNQTQDARVFQLEGTTWKQVATLVTGENRIFSTSTAGVYFWESEFSTKLSFEGSSTGVDMKIDPRSYTGSLLDISNIFCNLSSFDQDLSWMDTSKIVNFSYAFHNTQSFNSDLSWNVKKGEDFSWMFGRNPVFNSTGLDSWGTNKARNMNGMFYCCASFNQDLSGWNVKKVADFGSMFSGATTFNQDIGRWKTEGEEEMYSMFYNASAFNQDLSGWCVVNSTNLPSGFDTNSGFEGETALQPDWGLCPGVAVEPGSIVLDWTLGNFRIQGGRAAYKLEADGTTWTKVADAKDDGYYNYTLYFGTAIADSSYNDSARCTEYGTYKITGCTNSYVAVIGYYYSNYYDQTIEISDATDFSSMRSFNMAYLMNWNQDVSGWDVSNVQVRIYNCSKFNGDVNDWDTSKWTNMYGVIENCESFDGEISDWDVSNITIMSQVVTYCNAWNGDVSQWDTSKVTNIYSPFRGTAFNGDLSNWDVTNVVCMYEFVANTAFNNPSVNNLRFEKLANAAGSFYGTPFNQPITGNIFPAANNMACMFANTAMNSDISGLDTSNVRNMAYMFSNSPMNHPSIANLDTSAATCMYYMFENAKQFNQDIGGWDTTNVTCMYATFRNATTFDQDISGWCVRLIGSEPNYFRRDCPLTDDHSPKWGQDCS